MGWLSASENHSKSLVCPFLSVSLACANVFVVDAAILQDASRFKMDFAGGLQKCLHGEIKPRKQYRSLINQELIWIT